MVAPVPAAHRDRSCARGCAVHFWYPFWLLAFLVAGAVLEQQYHVVGDGLGLFPVDPKTRTYSDPSEQYAAAIEFARRSVVNITAKRAARGYTFRDLFDLWSSWGIAPPTRQSVALGSGLLIDEQGHIVTNYHVIEGAEEIEILTHEGRSFPVLAIGGSRKHDIFVLRLADRGNLPPARWGDSDDAKVGHVVFAIGNPFGFHHSATEGIISAINRKGLAPTPELDFLQTSAAINPGNSGGPLIDRTGRVIGVNAAIYSESGGDWGIGFAIPANRARQVAEAIIAELGDARPWLGLLLREPEPEILAALRLPPGTGVLVDGVVPGGPAALAGMEANDLITHWGDEPVTLDGFRTHMRAVTVGTLVSLRFRRGARVFAARLTVAKNPQADG